MIIVTMICRVALLVLFCQTLIGQKTIKNNNNAVNSIVSISHLKDISTCFINIYENWMNYVCPVGLSIDDLDISDMNSTILESIETLWVTNILHTKGPLTTFPSNVCRFTNLKSLQLQNNQIQNIHINFSIPCLPELRTLILSNNLLTEIPIDLFKQMSSLEYIHLSSNNLTCLPYDAFNNVSNLHALDIDINSLTTIELWTIQVQTQVNYRFNKINRFSNYFNVDLSNLQIRNLPTIIVFGNPEIYFDDTVYEMYNRCAEVHNTLNFSETYAPTLTRAIISIIEHAQPFYHRCDCNKYYFYRSALAVKYGHSNDDFFSNWICPGDLSPFIQKCNNQSSANFTDVVPRLCKINDSELGNVPVYANSSYCELKENIIPISTVTTTPSTFTTRTPSYLEILSNKTLDELNSITVLDRLTADRFVQIINQVNFNLFVSNDSIIHLQTQISFQNIIRRIENLIESINSRLNISDEGVGLISSTIANPIYHFTQFILSDSSIIYSSESEDNGSVASISIDPKYINQLTKDSYYTFFFLPSSLFQYAQIDSHIDIVSPIVGAHLPIEQSPNIEMSFYDSNVHRSSGSYSCVFWQFNQWNNTGCYYSNNLTTNRHYCHCNHLTSFALIFTPNGILRQTFLPTIITSCLSMIGLCISIILSIYQQTKPQAISRSRRFSITNIFSLSSTLILFILFTGLLINNYQSPTTQLTTSTPCQSSKLNLVLATYFFIILTFVTKTLVGLYYYFTTFTHFKLHLFSDQPDKWYLVSLLVIIIIALIPTIVASALSRQWNNIIISNNNVCWFHGIYLISFVTIPVSICIGINLIIVILISIRLFQFLFHSNVNQAKEKRLIIAACMWIASCVLLGILWVVGPLLNLFVNENGQSTSTVSQVVQWIFALLAGLEGVWVLIVNILFYLRQRSKTLRHETQQSKNNRKWYHIDDFGRINADIKENRYDFLQ